MNKINQETLKLIHSYKKEMALKFDRYHQATEARYEVVITRTRKTEALNIKQSMERLNERTSRYCIPLIDPFLSGEPSSDLAQSIRMFSVTVSDDQFKILSFIVPLVGFMIQPKFKLNSVISGMVITTHAIARYLERNKTTDINSALAVLGRAMIDCDRKLGEMQIFEKKLPIGYTERQIKCIDGGVAVVIIQDPSDNNYVSMEWAAVTYIDKSLINEWNNRKISENFDYTDLPFKPS